MIRNTLAYCSTNPFIENNLKGSHTDNEWVL